MRHLNVACGLLTLISSVVTAYGQTPPAAGSPEGGAAQTVAAPDNGAPTTAPQQTPPPAPPPPVPIAAGAAQATPAPSLNDAQIRAMLELMRDKGLISEKEYQAALDGRHEVDPEAAPPHGVTGKFDVNLYGFVELDSIYDTTQSFNELAGNALIARPGTYAGDHGRTLFTLRNSRLGFKFNTPEFHRVSVVAQMEFDLLGNQPPTATELQTFVNDTVRIRHAFLELRTPCINVLFGQTWELFGWQSYFFPATVAIQGVPGQIYSRTPQIRLSHVFKTSPVDVELAGALARAPQRDGMEPDGQFGLRLFINKWKGVHTTGATSTGIDRAAVGISGAVRQFTLADPTVAQPNDQTVSALGWGVSVDAVLPVIPAREKKAWAMTIHGNFVHGTGIADFYTGLTGGAAFPNTPPLPKNYPVDIDPGLAMIQNNLTLATVDWQSFMVGLQLYLPPQGKLWLASNFSQMDSDNITNFLAAGAMPGTYTNAVVNQTRWADVNLFWDVVPGVRLGAEYSWFWQRYHDEVTATNHRFQFSAFYVF